MRARVSVRSDRGQNRFDGRFRIGRHHQRVGAGFERQHGGLAARIALRDAAHLQRVGDDDALESHFAAQQAGEDGGRQRGRHIGGGQRRHGDVRGHDGIHARLDGRAEGRQFDALQALAAGVDHGHVQMRIHRRIAVSGEMLGGGEHAIVGVRAGALDERGHRAPIPAWGPRHRSGC
jgi:hypothetical protein